MNYPVPLSLMAQSASGIPSAAGGQTDTDALARFKQALRQHAALDHWIHIDGSQAIGILEQGRFESRFSPVTRFSGTPGTPGAPSAASQPQDRHRAETAADSDEMASDRKRPVVAGDNIGWRANLLAYDRTAILVSSTAMFASIQHSTLLISLDRMTRAMHSINFFASHASGLLFLPVHEGLLLNVRHDHGQYFAALLLSLRINPAKVVIEIPAVFAPQTSLLSQFVASYHRYGFKVAVNLPEAVDLSALPQTSKPDFLLSDANVEDSSPTEMMRRTAHKAVQTEAPSASSALAAFARHYGATLVSAVTA